MVVIESQLLAPPYHVETTEAQTLPNFKEFPNHRDVKGLWLEKWRPPCALGVYPFMDGNVEDFDPIFNELIDLSGGTTKILYDADAYATPFQPVAGELVREAQAAEKSGNTDKARDLYLRAAAVYRISRFPIIRTKLLQKVWRNQKAAYAAAGKYMKPALQEVEIPFDHCDEGKGDSNLPIQAYLRVPTGAPFSDAGHPVLLFLCGVDAYRPDHTPRYGKHLEGGMAVMSFEINGTGDCPGSKSDPQGPDRIMSSVIDWVYENAPKYNFDVSKICARGISTGGYYGMRVAHTHADRLFAVVAQGGGSHHMFDSSWIYKQDQMEYPYALAEALAFKFGYGSVDEYAKDDNARRRYSLIEGEDKVLEKKSCRMLIINGMEDSIFPIEDSILVAMKGHNKDLLCRGGLRHMGNPGGDDIVYEWLAKRLAGKP